MAADEQIGGVSIGVDADFSKLVEQFQEAINKAKGLADQLASTIQDSVKEPNTSGWQSALEKIGGGFGEAKKAALEFGSEMTGMSEKAVQGAAVLTGTLAAAFAAVGVAAFKAANDIDESFDHLRSATGATGAVLDGLEESFRSVFANVPVAAKEVSDAMALIYQRTGMVGQPLEELTTKMAQLAHMTGEQVLPLTSAVTRAFGDAGIAAKDQSKALDEMFRASQATGMGMTELLDRVVQFGAPMRAFGFSFQDSLAVMGQFQKDGVNLQTVLSGMKQALGNFAKAGEDPVVALKDVIEKIKGTTDASEQMSLALGAFGKRAASDWIDAIKGGHLELGTLLDKIKNGSDTINQAAKDTERFGEKWKIFKNRVEEALEPLGKLLSEGLQRLLDLSAPVLAAIKEIGEAMTGSTESASTFSSTLGEAFSGLAGDIGEQVSGIIEDFKGIGTAAAGIFEDLKPEFEIAALALSPLIDGVRNLAGLMGGFTAEGLKNALKAVLDAAVPVLGILNNLKPLLDEIKVGFEKVKAAADLLSGDLNTTRTATDAAQGALDRLNKANGDAARAAAEAAMQTGKHAEAVNHVATEVASAVEPHIRLAQATHDLVDNTKNAADAQKVLEASMGAIDTKVDQLRNTLTNANANLLTAKQHFEAIKAAAENGAAGTAELEKAEGLLAKAAKEAAEAQKNLNAAIEAANARDAKTLFDALQQSAKNMASDITDAANDLNKFGLMLDQVAPKITPLNKAMIDFGIGAGKAKTAVEDLKTPVEQLTTSLGNLVEKAKSSGDWSEVIQALDNFDKRIQTIAKTDLPEAVKEMEAWIGAMQRHNAPAELVQGQLDKLSPLIEKMAKEGLPGATEAWSKYLDMLKKVPTAIQDIQKSQEQQLQKDEAILAAMKQRGDAYGYILQQQAKVLQEDINISEQTGKDATAQVLALEGVRVKQEQLATATHGYADEMVKGVKDIISGFDSLAGSMSDAIVNGKNLGDALVGSFKKIGQSLLTDVIQAGMVPLREAMLEIIGQLLPNLDLGLKVTQASAKALTEAMATQASVIQGVVDADLAATAAKTANTGATVADTGATVADTAATAISTAATAVDTAATIADTGATIADTVSTIANTTITIAATTAEIALTAATIAATAATIALATTITAVGAAVGAIAGIVGDVYLARISHDTGKIEVNTRAAEAQLTNIWETVKSNFKLMYERVGEIKNAADAMSDSLKQISAKGAAGGLPDQVIIDIADIAAFAKKAFAGWGIFSTMQGALETIARDIVTWDGYIIDRLDVIVQKLGYIATKGLSGNEGSADIASDADIAAAADDISAAVGESADEITDAVTSGTESIGSDLVAHAATITGAIINDGDRQASISEDQLTHQISAAAAAAAKATSVEGILNGLRAEYKAYEALLQQAIEKGDTHMADVYRQQMLNLQGQITPLLSAEVTYSRDAAAAEGQLASTLPKAIEGVGFAAKGAGTLVAASIANMQEQLDRALQLEAQALAAGDKELAAQYEKQAQMLKQSINTASMSAITTGASISAHIDANGQLISASIYSAAVAQAAFLKTAIDTLITVSSTFGKGGGGSVGNPATQQAPTSTQQNPGVPVGQQPGFYPTGGQQPSAPANLPNPATNTGTTRPTTFGQNPTIIPDATAIPMLTSGGQVLNAGVAVVHEGEHVFTSDQLVRDPLHTGEAPTTASKSGMTDAEFAAILAAAWKTDEYLKLLKDQVDSQQQWINIAIANHAPPAMMELLTKQMAQYQAGLLRYEEEMGYVRKNTQKAADALATGVPIVQDPNQGSTAGSALKPEDVFGTPEYIAKHLSGDKGTAATTSKPAPSTPDQHPLPGTSEFPHLPTTPAPTPPPISAGPISTQQFYSRALFDLDGILKELSGGTATAPTTSSESNPSTSPLEMLIELKQRDIDAKRIEVDAAKKAGAPQEQINAMNAMLAVMQEQLDELKKQRAAIETTATAATLPTTLKGGPVKGPAFTDPATIFGTPEWIAAQVAKGNASIAQNPAVFGSPAWIDANLRPGAANVADNPAVFGTPAWIKEHLGDGAGSGKQLPDFGKQHPLPGSSEMPRPEGGSAPFLPPSAPFVDPAAIAGNPNIFGTPAWIAAQQAAGQAATAAAAGTAAGSPSGAGSINDMDQRTIGYYAGSLAELEDIRNTLHAERDILSSMREGLVTDLQAIIEDVSMIPDLAMMQPNYSNTISGNNNQVLTINAPITVNGVQDGRTLAKTFAQHIKHAISDAGAFTS